MGRVKIIINGKQTWAEDRETILEVAQRHKIFIPTLCHDRRLEPFGSCRVCLVKVHGSKYYAASCATKVTKGMIIDTESPDVIEARQMSLALLISDHYGDCVAPCTIECPAHIDIQGYVALIKAKRYQQAVKLIKEKNPLPLTIGRICPHPCEEVCRRNRVEEPVAINNLKRFTADYDIALKYPYLPEREPSKGKKIAVIGSGPAGLTVAYYLAIKGYDVTIFEKREKAGGMLRYGIPAYRLPRDILDREIKLIEDMGVKIQYNRELGMDFTLKDLKDEGFSAVFLGLGAQKSLKIHIEGENLKNVIEGLEFLNDVETGRGVNLSGKLVVVVGGGNTAMDAARISLRLGAEKVTILYRRTKKEMPANEKEIEEAEEEGIIFEFLSAPIRISEKNDLLDIECIRMELGPPDSSGRRRPVPVQGSNYHILAYNLITAIGQVVDHSPIKKEKLVTLKDTIKANPLTGITEEDFLFAGGDCVTGAATAIEAIGSGRRAAISIDLFLQTGIRLDREDFEFNISKGDWRDIPEEYFPRYEKSNRVKMPVLQVNERVKGFNEIEIGLAEDEALREASRCLECGCIEGFTCGLRDYSTSFKVKQDEFLGEKNHYRELDNITQKHPPILSDENKCIKCGLCVRVCDELWGLSIFGFVKRGFEMEVSPYFDLDLKDTACDFCGGCADICPTGALSLNTYLEKPGPFKVEERRGICINCSLGCELEFNAYENMLIKNNSCSTMGENDGMLCVRGRFGYSYLTPGERCFDFMEIFHGQKVKIKEKYGIKKASEIIGSSKRLGVFTSTNLSNEEYEKLHELVRGINAETFHIPYDFSEYKSDKYPVVFRTKHFENLIKNIPIPSLSDIEKSNTIVLFNVLPGRSYPILEMKIRNAVKRGAELFIINEKPTRLDDYASEVYRIKEHHYRDFMNLLGSCIANNLKNLSCEVLEYNKTIEINKNLPFVSGIKLEKIKKLAKNLFSESSISFIADETLTRQEDLLSFIMLILTKKEASKLLLMQRGTNPLGAIKHVKKEREISHISKDTLTRYDTLLLYKLPGLFDLSGKRVIHFGFKPLSDYGDYGIFIPSSSLLETGGKIYLYNGREVKLKKVLKKDHGIDNVKNLNKLIRLVYKAPKVKTYSS